MNYNNKNNVITLLECGFYQSISVILFIYQSRKDKQNYHRIR